MWKVGALGGPAVAGIPPFRSRIRGFRQDSLMHTVSIIAMAAGVAWSVVRERPGCAMVGRIAGLVRAGVAVVRADHRRRADANAILASVEFGAPVAVIALRTIGLGNTGADAASAAVLGAEVLIIARRAVGLVGIDAALRRADRVGAWVVCRAGRDQDATRSWQAKTFARIAREVAGPAVGGTSTLAFPIAAAGIVLGAWVAVVARHHRIRVNASFARNAGVVGARIIVIALVVGLTFAIVSDEHWQECLARFEGPDGAVVLSGIHGPVADGHVFPFLLIAHPDGRHDRSNPVVSPTP